MLSEQIYHIVYRSHATPGIDQEAVNNILQTARKFNSTQNITGILIFRDGDFLQLLEGNEIQVKQLYDKIAKDRRHTSITKMLSTYSDKRIYDQWSMAYVDLNTAKGSVQSLWDLFDSLIEGDEDNTDYIQPLLKKFLDTAPHFLK